MQAVELRQAIFAEAHALGFAKVGLGNVLKSTHAHHYKRWIKDKKHGDMGYLEKPVAVDLRANPQKILEEAKSVITVALPYSAQNPKKPKESHCEIAKYARGKDYHQVMWTLLETLAKKIEQLSSTKLIYRVCVDTAPVLERELAASTGLGFIGKNTMLIAPGVGSYVFLGELFINIELPPTSTKAMDCGECTACIDACPTQAFDAPYVLDANKCISYLTIENKSDIPKELAEHIGNRVFGCDVCQDVCPYNKIAPLKQNVLTQLGDIKTEDAYPIADKLKSLGSNQFKKWTKDKALRRFHLRSLKRNLSIVDANQNQGHHLQEQN